MYKFSENNIHFLGPCDVWKMKTLTPNSPIFWNWTHKNITNRQHSARFWKSRKSAKSLHPTVQEQYVYLFVPVPIGQSVVLMFTFTLRILINFLFMKNAFIRYWWPTSSKRSQRKSIYRDLNVAGKTWYNAE